MNKLNPKQKLVVYGILILWVAIIFMLAKPTKHEVIGWDTWTVQPGNTLYEVAGYFPHDDIRELVFAIEQENDTTALLQIGKELRIPILKVEGD